MPRPASTSWLRNQNQENPMTISHYIGLDVHKKSISYCVKTADGTITEEGKLRATRQVLRQWAGKRQQPWHGAMEATLFSSWIYDALQPFAAKLEMGNPSMMKAIGAAKKKSDRLDARKIADLVRCNLLPACYVASVENAGAAAVAAVSEHGGGACGADEEQNERAADGSGGGVQQTATAREEVFHRVDGRIGGSAGIGEGYAAVEPERAGDVRDDAAATTEPARKGAGAGETLGTAAQHWRGGRGDVADLGAGGLRPAAIPVDWRCAELLRADLGTTVVGRQTAAGADLQAAQSASANRPDRGGEAGAAVEQSLGGVAPTGIAPWQSQPRHTGGGAEAGSVSVGGGQIGQTVRGTHPASQGNGGRESGVTRCLELSGAIGRKDHPTPAGCSHATIDQRFTGRSSPLWGCTTEVLLPMCLQPVSRPAGLPKLNLRGRLCCSRKWMSGPADALAQSVTDRKRSIVALTVGFIMALQILPGSAGSSVFPLDKSLSWMPHNKSKLIASP